MQHDIFRFRCVAQRRRNRWIATCTDLGVVAIGVNFLDARGRLRIGINERINQVLFGADGSGQKIAVSPRYAARYRLKYYWLALLTKCRLVKYDAVIMFNEQTMSVDIPAINHSLQAAA